jgi:RNA polymerase sigma-70 factor (ECF subfamily)
MTNESSRGSVPPDAEIIRRVCAADSAAYATLVERYERAVLASVLAVIPDVHAAQDVAQEVFVHCYLKLAGLRDGDRFSGWLLKTAHRRAVRAAQTLKRGRQVALAGAREDGEAEDRLFDDEKERLLVFVQNLPAHERLVISLRYFESRSVPEIAQLTGRPVGTITKQLSRAIRRLRTQLSRSDSHAR